MALNFSNSKKPLHEAVGQAMEEYAGVEARLAAVLGALLKVDHRKSHTIFFAVGNVRSRLELIEKLFALHIPKEMHRDFSKFWDSCSIYLGKLAVFRNAVAHWHPYTNLYVKSEGSNFVARYAEAALGHPIPGMGYKSLEARDFPPFIEDCRYACEFLSALGPLAKRKPRSLPEKFRTPIPRPNQAALQPRQKPTTQQPLRKPSTPKLSRAQKRAKALKDARTKKKA